MAFKLPDAPKKEPVLQSSQEKVRNIVAGVIAVTAMVAPNYSFASQSHDVTQEQLNSQSTSDAVQRNAPQPQVVLLEPREENILFAAHYSHSSHSSHASHSSHYSCTPGSTC